MKILLVALAVIFLGILFVWTAGAFYYDVGQRGWTGWICLLLWTVAFVLTLVYVKPFWVAVVSITVAVGCVIGWWLTQKPTHDRVWEPSYATLPKFVVDGDEITVHNLRNAFYRTPADYDLIYETRTYRFSDLKTADILILDWGIEFACHPMVVFDFGNDQHLCISIEVRYRKGEDYDTVRSLYRQNELMYVVSDERDAILKRTTSPHKQLCRLYRLQRDRDQVRQLLEEYIEQTNEIHETPRWYNTLVTSCSTSIYRQRHGKIPWDWRIMINGEIDQMLYEWGRLYQGVPFGELKQASCINDKANVADDATFHSEIREGLPGFETSSKAVD